jgi:ABC-type transport system involved in cytochrome bd biosynthesis fused ATPase/permease subunit
MIKLLASLYKPSGGVVTVDGTPLHSIDTSRQFAWMEQECNLLTGTLRDNLIAGSQRQGLRLLSRTVCS